MTSVSGITRGKELWRGRLDGVDVVAIAIALRSERDQAWYPAVYLSPTSYVRVIRKQFKSWKGATRYANTIRIVNKAGEWAVLHG